MKSLLIYIFLFSLMVSCGKEEENNILTDTSINDGTEIGTDPLPNNSPGVTDVRIDNTLNFTVTIPAFRKYLPGIAQDGLYYVPKNSDLKLPEQIRVTEGLSGLNLVVISIFRKNSDSLPGKFKCVYKPKERNPRANPNAKPRSYHFDFCLAQEINVNYQNREKYKQSEYNILDSSQKERTFFYQRADRLVVHVGDGVPNRDSDTKDAITRIEAAFERTQEEW